MTTSSKLPQLRLIRPAHPSELILEYLPGITFEQLADILKCPIPTAKQILHYQATLSLEMCLRLAHYFDTTLNFWNHLQYQYEVSKLYKEEQTIKEEIDKLKRNNHETN